MSVTAAPTLAVSVTRGALLDGLRACSVVRDDHPVYSGVTIVRDEVGRVWLRTADRHGSTAAALVGVEADDAQPCSASVDTKAFTAIVRNLAPGRSKAANAMVLELNATDGSLLIEREGERVTSLPLQGTAHPGGVAGQVVGSIDTELLRHMVTTTAHAADATARGKAEIWGAACIRSDGPNLTVRATDRYVLASVTEALPVASEPFQVFPTAAVLAKAVSHLSEPVTTLLVEDEGITLDSNRVRYTLARHRHRHRGRSDYPDFGHQMTPPAAWVDVDRSLLLATTKLANACTKPDGIDQNIRLRIPFDGTGATLHNANQPNAEAIGAPIPLLDRGRTDGLDDVDHLETCNDPRYLQQALEHLAPCSVVRLYISTEGKATTLCDATRPVHRDHHAPRIIVCPKRPHA